jgi:hypothetical protein
MLVLLVIVRTAAGCGRLGSFVHPREWGGPAQEFPRFLKAGACEAAACAAAPDDEELSFARALVLALAHEKRKLEPRAASGWRSNGGRGEGRSGRRRPGACRGFRWRAREARFRPSGVLRISGR